MTPQDLLRLHPFFAALPARDVEKLLLRASCKSVRAGRQIFQKDDPGDGLYGVLVGHIAFTVDSEDGRVLTLNVLGPGEFFGEIAIFDGRPRTASAAAMERADLLRIHRDHFLPYVKANPDLIVRMLSLVCDRLRWASSTIEDTAFLSFPARIAKRLLFLADHHRRPEGHDITIPISQHDLGNMVGASRETVNKQLALWRSAGVLDTGRGTLVIRNPDALRDLIGCA